MKQIIEIEIPEGKKAIWKNGKIKYSICRYDDKYRAIQTVERNHFLTFQSMELAEKFLKNFKDLIKQSGDLI